jgi:hypothetical protein
VVRRRRLRARRHTLHRPSPVVAAAPARRSDRARCPRQHRSPRRVLHTHTSHRCRSSLRCRGRRSRLGAPGSRRLCARRPRRHPRCHRPRAHGSRVARPSEGAPRSDHPRRGRARAPATAPTRVPRPAAGTDRSRSRSTPTGRRPRLRSRHPRMQPSRSRTHDRPSPRWRADDRGRGRVVATADSSVVPASPTRRSRLRARPNPVARTCRRTWDRAHPSFRRRIARSSPPGRNPTLHDSRREAIASRAVHRYAVFAGHKCPRSIAATAILSHVAPSRARRHPSRDIQRG